MKVVPDKQQNLRHAEEMVRQAAAAGADIVVLPEMFCCEYMNSYITSFIMSVLRKLSSIELKGYKVSFNWYYEDGDEDMLERGEFMSSSLAVDFVFIRYHERTLCA